MKSQVSQKNRCKIISSQVSASSSGYRIKTRLGGRFEYIYFFHVKKILKRLCVNRKSYFIRRQVLFFVSSNFPLSKKAKNARMGSGKGYFLRWSIRMRKNSTLVYARGIPIITLRRVVGWWNLSLAGKLYIY